MTKIIIALLALVIGIIVLSFGTALGIFGIMYLVKGFALYITDAGYGITFVVGSLGLWLLSIANTILWGFNKLLNPISEMVFGDDK